jgi:GPH family glycoside/pentoside/hexuronide:cation symporter
MSFWVGLQVFIMFIQPAQKYLILLIAFLAGLNVSNAHVMPEAIFPDVIDWDELRTNQRREGIYYGAINFLRKLSSAIATFVALQILGWFGYQTPPEGAIVFMQPPSAVLAIRILTGPTCAILLLAAIIVAWNYPLTRDRQARIQRSLRRRQQKELRRQTQSDQQKSMDSKP